MSNEILMSYKVRKQYDVERVGEVGTVSTNKTTGRKVINKNVKNCRTKNRTLGYTFSNMYV